MGEKAITYWLKKKLLKTIYWLFFLLVLCNAMILLILHMIVPFFPILFLFNFSFWFGYPVFLEHVLKKSGLSVPKTTV